MTKELQNVNIRKAIKSDVPALFALINELAVFEKAPEEVINTEEKMREEGFGESPYFHAFVAEVDGRVVGMSLVYFRYSTWKGKTVYLEDLIVNEPFRNRGIGKLLFERTLAFAREENCARMTWQVLDWNEPAILFYKNYGSQFDNGWVNAFIDI
jgi:GNAT superfamily N-acetyltransferase